MKLIRFFTKNIHNKYEVRPSSSTVGQIDICLQIQHLLRRVRVLRVPQLRPGVPPHPPHSSLPPLPLRGLRVSGEIVDCALQTLHVYRQNESIETQLKHILTFYNLPLCIFFLKPFITACNNSPKPIEGPSFPIIMCKNLINHYISRTPACSSCWQVWQYYLLPEEEQRMPGVKNPMCNAFPRIGRIPDSRFQPNKRQKTCKVKRRRVITARVMCN